MNLVILVYSLHDLGYLNAHSKKSFYRAANAVFGKFGKTASEKVTLQLVISKCVFVLLYGLKACPLNASDIRSLYFVINQFFNEIV